MDQDRTTTELKKIEEALLTYFQQTGALRQAVASLDVLEHSIARARKHVSRLHAEVSELAVELNKHNVRVPHPIISNASGMLSLDRCFFNALEDFKHKASGMEAIKERAHE